MSIDTRTLRPGDLFFAITGEASDGHDYVAAAFARGASAAVVDEARSDDLKGTGVLYIVRDVLKALEALASIAQREDDTRALLALGKTALHRGFPLDTAIPVEARAGDLLVFNYLTVHGSGLNVSDEPRTTWLVQVRDPERGRIPARCWS